MHANEWRKTQQPFRNETGCAIAMTSEHPVDCQQTHITSKLLGLLNAVMTHLSGMNSFTYVSDWRQRINSPGLEWNFYWPLDLWQSAGYSAVNTVIVAHSHQTQWNLQGKQKAEIKPQHNGNKTTLEIHFTHIESLTSRQSFKHCPLWLGSFLLGFELFLLCPMHFKTACYRNNRPVWKNTLKI